MNVAFLGFFFPTSIYSLDPVFGMSFVSSSDGWRALENFSSSETNKKSPSDSHLSTSAMMECFVLTVDRTAQRSL